MHNQLRKIIRSILNEELGIDSDGNLTGSLDGNVPVSKYEVISYDVWGNKDDGYEVNQSFHTGKFVEVPDDLEITPKDVIIILKREGVVDDKMNILNTEVDLSHDNAIYFHRIIDNKPLFELRKTD
jgi:hypothetical protein